MRRRVGTLLLCSFLLPLAACGDNGDGDTASSPTTKATTAATAAAGETADDSSGSTDEPAEAPEGAADDDFCGVLIEQAAKVADFLGDFANFALIHPLIIDIAQGEPRPSGLFAAPAAAAAPPRRFYKVTDRLPCGPLSIHIRYDVALTQAGPQALLFEAWQRPRIHLHNRISWQALPPGGTRVREQMTLHAPALLLPLVKRMAQAAHADSFARLKERLELGK